MQEEGEGGIVICGPVHHPDQAELDARAELAEYLGVPERELLTTIPYLEPNVVTGRLLNSFAHPYGNRYAGTSPKPGEPITTLTGRRTIK